MALEDIITKINQEASLKAEEILSEAKKKESEIISSAQKKAESLKDEMLKKALEKEKKAKESALALTNLERRKNILKFRQSMVWEVYNKLLEDLYNLSIEDYRDFIGNILAKYAGGDEEVIISSSDSNKITKEFIKYVNKELTNKDKKGNLTLSDERRNLDGGVILRKGKLEINYSFGNLIKNLREKTEQEVVKILFDDT